LVLGGERKWNDRSRFTWCSSTRRSCGIPQRWNRCAARMRHKLEPWSEYWIQPSRCTLQRSLTAIWLRAVLPRRRYGRALRRAHVALGLEVLVKELDGSLPCQFRGSFVITRSRIVMESVVH